MSVHQTYLRSSLDLEKSPCFSKFFLSSVCSDWLKSVRLCLYIIHNITPWRKDSFSYTDADTESHITIMSKLYSMHPCEEMKVTKPSGGTCLPSGHSSSSVWDVTSWAEFNQEGHRVCLAHKTTDSLAFSPALLKPALLFPFQICTEAAPSVRFTYSIGCQGLQSDQRGIVKSLRSTPRLLIIQRS